MTLTINGENRDCPSVKNVAELVEALRLPGPALLIEHNGLALRRDEWELRTVAEGDAFELMKIAAGG